MKCESVRDQLFEFRKGWLEGPDATAIRTHLDACPACQGELDVLSRTLDPLAELEEVTPSPEVWTRLSHQVALSQVHHRRFRFVRATLGIAAAASLIVVLFSFFLVYSSQSGLGAIVTFVPPGEATDLQVGQTIPMQTPLRTPTYLVLTLPDVGTLKLNPSTRLEFLSRRRMRLYSGEFFAEILPDGRGFVVDAPDATVTVHGTRFGLRSGHVPTLLYVLEGEVEMAGTSGRLTVRSGQVAHAGAFPSIGKEEAVPCLEWLGAYEHPAVRLDLKQSTASPSGWTLTLSTDSLIPLSLRTLRDAEASFFARVEPEGKAAFNVPLEAADIRVESGTAGGDGLFQFDSQHPVVFAVLFDPGLHQPGSTVYRVSFVYVSRPDPGRRTLWAGLVESNSATVEIKR